MRTCRGRRQPSPFSPSERFPGTRGLADAYRASGDGLVSAASAIPAGAYIAVGLGRPRMRVATEATPVSHVEVRSFA